MFWRLDLDPSIVELSLQEHEKKLAKSLMDASEINRAFWEYTEVLEGASVELFNQVSQVTPDRGKEISVTVKSIKDLLLQRIEALKGKINHLEAKNNWWERFLRKKKVDPLLLKHLNQTQKYLKSQFELFTKQNNEYLLLDKGAKESIKNLQSFPVFGILERSNQEKLQGIFRLLKMIESDPKGDLSKQLKRALNQLSSVENVLQLFRKYLYEIQDSLFNSSHEWKSFNHEDADFPRSFEKIYEFVNALGVELDSLMFMMGRYRSYLLKNDPDPYVGTRLGFTEWIVGSEPKKAVQFSQLIYAAQEVRENIKDFKNSLEQDIEKQHNLEYHAHEEIERLLHEMRQPLISRTMMHKKAERLLNAVKICDELGSSQISTIFYVEKVLLAVLRADSNFLTLYEFPLFHRLYRLHMGLEEKFDDKSHFLRIEKMKLLFLKVLEWANRGDVDLHAHEIELDSNDMKAYLQDFLGSIQRACKEKETDSFFDEAITKFYQQLLEFRYLFGQFFFNLNKISDEGRELRHQFFFVDQYLDSIEGVLKEGRETSSF